VPKVSLHEYGDVQAAPSIIDHCMLPLLCSPECMMSNDVLEYELQLAAANHDKLDENDLAIRYHPFPPAHSPPSHCPSPRVPSS
jgi:hypothetical protein